MIRSFIDGFFNVNRLMNRFDISPSNEWSKILSHREFTIAILVARGLSNKTVAQELGLTEGTVKVHLNRIFQKLGAKRRYDLIIPSKRS